MPDETKAEGTTHLRYRQATGFHKSGKMLGANALLRWLVATSKNLQQYSRNQEQMALKTHPLDF